MVDIISKKTQEEYNTLIEDTESFINSVITEKYITNDESCYDDIITNRIKTTLETVEPNNNRIKKINQLMLDKKFIPAGSILSGLGLTHLRKVTLSNCYYVPIEYDSLDGIYEAKKRMVKVYSRRGGCGTSITILRPKKTPVRNAAKYSTGSVSFLPGFSQDVHDIGQSGRRGAALADIDCRHPDLLDFIWCKSKPEQVFPKDQFTGILPNVNFINLSIQVTDEFMKAVDENKEWKLFFPDIEFEKYKTEWDGDYDKWINKGYPTITYQTINAREILKQIAEASWLTGDPGLLFRNQAQKYSTGFFDPKLCPVGVNPCLPNWAPVLTPNGYKYFKDVKNEVLLENQKYNCSDVIKTQESADVYRIELESGLQLYATDNHVIQKDVNNSFVDIELKNLSINDKIKVDYNTINLPINEKEYSLGYDNIYKIKKGFSLYNKTFSFQMGFIHGILERTDSFIGGNDGFNYLIKGVHLKNSFIFEQIQTILTSINVYSEIEVFNDKFNLLKIFELEEILNRFTLNDQMKSICTQIIKDYTDKQRQEIQKLKYSQKIINIGKLEKKYPVYDINVPNKNYFVSSACVVHNCGEQWLQRFGNCLLAAFVLYKYVKNPYTKEAEFDIDKFLEDIKYAVCFLDNMIDINKHLHPWDEQKETDEYGRRLGIETTGVHDMLAMLNIEYGSDKSIECLNDIYFSKAVEEIKSSIELAKEKGCAPCLKTKKSRNAFIDQPYIKRVLNKLLRSNREKIKNNILKYGIRNSAFNTNGPTGSLSLIADNCSSGIEPIYEIEYLRESRIFNKKIRVLHLPLVKHVGPKILDLTKEEITKKYHYTPAHEMDYSKRIRVQSIIQKWTDASISSTINLKNQASIEDIYNIYISGWKNNLKGITIFRDGCKKGVLSTDGENKNDENKIIINNDVIINHLNHQKNEMIKTQRGYRYIKFWKKVKVYITVTINDSGRPLEIFANVPYEAGMNGNGIYQPEMFMEKKSYWDTICRMTSLLLRLNVPIEEIVKQLEKSSPAMTELPNIINHILKNFIVVDDEKIEKIKKQEIAGEYCPECKKNGLIYQGGCMTCVLCGYNKCG